MQGSILSTEEGTGSEWRVAGQEDRAAVTRESRPSPLGSRDIKGTWLGEDERRQTNE